MKLLVLYSEVAGYFLACVREYASRYGEVHLVKWPVNKEAPFDDEKIPNVTFYEKSQFDYESLLKLCNEIGPDILYVTGWLDRDYLRIAREFHKRGVPAICTLDNQWQGTLRQRIGALISPLYLKPRFTHIGVPGMYQFEFARRLGYPRNRIITGMYAADTEMFTLIYHNKKSQPDYQVPKKFLYVGRLVEIKGIEEMCRAFIRAEESTGQGWELWIAGTGPLEKELPDHPAIIKKGFVQPRGLPSLAEECGVFVLPSRVEPWGVVMHEFASAGMPVIGSDTCGSSAAFLRHEYNGFLFEAGNAKSLERAFLGIMNRPAEELQLMGQRSYELSRQITTVTWATSIHGAATQL